MSFASLIWEFIDLGLGFANQAVSRLFPFRKIAARPEVAWDVIGVAATVVFVYFAESILEVPSDWLLSFASIDGWGAMVESWPWWVAAPLYLILADLGAYWAHRLLHTRRLWPTHAWHHSPRYLYWASGLRGSPIHTLVLLAPYAIVYVFFPIPDIEAVAVAIAIIDIGNQHFIHSNIRVPFHRQLERIIITPRFHFVHHSTIRTFTDSNYGFIFSWWDRLFGTYTDPDKVPVEDPLGLDYENSNVRLLLGLAPSPARGRGQGEGLAGRGAS